MYECPDGCGSRMFHQTVTQRETVHVDDSGDPFNIEADSHIETKSVECAECGATVIEDDQRTFIVHPDGTGEIYNLQQVEEADLPASFRQFILEEHESWQDVAKMWVFYDATHSSEAEIAEILETHNSHGERILEHADFIEFNPFIHNSLSVGDMQ